MLVAPAAPRRREMSREPRRRVGAEESSAAPRRKRARATRKAFDVKKEVFAVGRMSGKERKILRERFQTELVAVRGLLEKAEFLVDVPEAVEGGHAAPSSPSLAASRCRDGRFLAAGPRSEEPMEADKSKGATKRRKTSPFVEEHVEAPKMMTPAAREQLAFRLASLSTELSAHTVKLLQKRSHGRRGRSEIEVDIYSMEDQALLELKMQLDKFVKTRNPSPQEREEGKIVDEEEEDEQDDECVDLCGGVSPLAIAPSPLQLEILEYGDIFGATVLVEDLLSPLQQKYVALAEKEDEEYVDICGDASPVVIQKLGEITRSPSNSSSSDSDSDSDSDSSSGSDSSDSEASGSDSDSDVAVLSKVNDGSARSPEPAQEVVQINAEPEKVSSPAPAVLSKVNDGSALPSDQPSPEALQNAEPEKLPVNLQRGDAPPPARLMSELIAEAQERRQQEERSRAREKARQELVEMERTAMACDRIQPMEMEQLGITQVEHVVSAPQPTVGPGFRPSLLQQLGLVLKADDGGGEEQDKEQLSSDHGVEDLEEGEIR